MEESLDAFLELSALCFFYFRHERMLIMYKLLTLSQCLKMMKVKPIVSKRKIKSCLLGEVEAPKELVQFADEIYHEELVEFWKNGYPFCESFVLTSPCGAKVLLDLYDKGFFEKNNDKYIIDNVLLEYIEHADDLNTYNEKREAEYRDKKRREEEELEYWASHLDNLPDDKFTSGFLDKLFWKINGAGDGELIINGKKVYKQCILHKSNSGKHSDYDVRIYYTDSEGVRHELPVNVSMYEGNRRSRGRSV